MKSVEVFIDISELKRFFDRLGQAARGDFKKEMSLFLQGIGTEFLRILQDEIIRKKVMDTRLLLASFQQGADGNVWTLNESNLTLEVGTITDYASYTNDGHLTNPKGVEKRFIPGRWQGDRFIYEPGANTGMVLKQQWIPGTKYFESALKILEKMYPKLLEAKLQAWINEYFKDVI